MQSFQLCDRCKRCSGKAALQTLVIGTNVEAWLCFECTGQMREQIKAECSRVPIPEALKPYLQD